MKLVSALIALSSSILAASALVPDPTLPKLHNGQQIKWNYDSEILTGNDMFGVGALKLGSPLPDNAFDFERWEGQNILGLYDADQLPAIFLLNYAFFQVNATYIAQLFSFDTTTGALTRPYIRQKSFVWVNRPGLSD